MHVFRERASSITQTKYCPKQDHGQSMTSSYYLNKLLREEVGAHTCKKVLFLCERSSFTNRFEANMTACRCVVQDCSDNSNPRIGISLHTPKSNYELAKGKSFVRTHSSNFNLKGLFKIYSVHSSSDCFKPTVHIEGAAGRLISRSIPTI